MEQRAQLASQVSHDIRSPLAALNMVIVTFNELPENQRVMIRSAIQRINDIANMLLQKSKTDFQNTSEIKPTVDVFMISSLVDPIVTEKRLEFRELIDIQIETEISKAYGLFIKSDRIEFKRMLSNIINNAIEAFENKMGLVKITIREENHFCDLIIEDNGKGIPKNIIDKLGAYGFSFGKTDLDNTGSGLGLYFAKQFVDRNRGTLQLKSEINHGTQITICLPKVHPPSWFVSELNVKTKNFVVVLDDDQSIHNIWKEKFRNVTNKNPNFKIQCFTSGNSLSDWLQNMIIPCEQMLFLIDYELLNQPMNGLDIIYKFNISEQSVLVTSRYEEPKVLEHSTKLGVKMIPKVFAALVPIVANE